MQKLLRSTLIAILFLGGINAMAQDTDQQFAQARIAHDKQDYAQEIKLLQPLANQGNSKAQAILGSIYLRGTGVKKDLAKSITLLEKSAKQGNAQSMLLLFYANQESQKPTTALQWLRQSANTGNANAQLILGTLYYMGNPNMHIKQDYTQARQWLEKSADQHNSRASYILADLYFSGKGVVVNNNTAIKWLMRSAKDGNPEAQKIITQTYKEVSKQKKP